jgi:hypothetical protein
MKRFLLFCFDDYYPLGGWNDFKGSFATLDEAEERQTHDNCQILDIETGEIREYTYGQRRRKPIGSVS